jgi:DNA-binding NtrC family response regulator
VTNQFQQSAGQLSLRPEAAGLAAHAMHKVLMIEDEATLANALKRVLESGGFDVTIVNDPAKGLAAGRDGDYQVVVTDLKMPGLSGMEIIKSLHEAKPQLPVILLTGYHTTEAAIEAMKLGAYDYVTKPPQGEDFLELVKQAASNSARMSGKVEIGEATQGSTTWAEPRMWPASRNVTVIPSATGKGLS